MRGRPLATSVSLGGRRVWGAAAPQPDNEGGGSGGAEPPPEGLAGGYGGSAAPSHQTTKDNHKLSFTFIKTKQV